ncbi:hypothetical protein FRACYDRAFT_184910 [Fragilariopsis cylindrus CCMP1102]|uniref:SET domain-containing protein n=1 Tax=Fragilariopsis cylindrus CCMP1102 TaxID=635003 RepID=A0A1E7FIF6_9STRA|nr:hypothetical protein FRACYDRAFT_184910 [Fragilariopsis cylindrus CCMP1102]|eukprot:OEU17961.1 hypothetical protein FRACYDRAFT_184910 [Fragilariopsis cylindrus CCMP1102]
MHPNTNSRLLISATTTTTDTTDDTADTDTDTSYIECELYIAESTIPNAGNGIFSGISKKKNEYIGNGDKAIPIIDVWWHNNNGDNNGGSRNNNKFFNPVEHYVWEGSSMGMGLEVFSHNDLSTFWPGIDAIVNCHAGLLNVEKSTPHLDDGGVHRRIHPSAGSISPYNSMLQHNGGNGGNGGSGGGSSKVSRDIPIGGELFKNYGEEWFLYRTQLGPIPVQSNYIEILQLMSTLQVLVDYNNEGGSIIYNEFIKEMQIIWNNSRTLNALYDFTWNDILTVLGQNSERERERHDDMGILLQQNATRSIDYLQKYGKCIDHIIHKQSTINGAGHGGFAKRDLPKGTVITGTPLIHFPNINKKNNWFHMYDYQYCDNGQIMVRNRTNGPYGQQLLLNYCFSHSETTVVVCPYGSGINYINHATSTATANGGGAQHATNVANVKIQWSKNGTTNHNDDWLLKTPKEMIDYNYTTHLAFDYIAIRDIQEGEELFLDYGTDWENKWNRFQTDWLTYDHDTPYLKDYISAIEYNTLYGNDILPTKFEEQEQDDEEQQQSAEVYYPNNLFLRCHSILDIFENDQDVIDYDRDDYFIEYYNNWGGEHVGGGDNNGYECEILERHNYEFADTPGETESYYTVQFIKNNNHQVTKRIFGVNRKLIKFADKPYSKF